MGRFGVRDQPRTACTIDMKGQLEYSICASPLVKVWDRETGAPIATLRHQGLIQDVSFSPDGRFLATNVWMSEESGMAPASVWMWNLRDLVAEACARLPRNLTRDEWTSALGDQPYRKTCDRLPPHPSVR